MLVTDGSGKALERRMRITRLGEGVDRTGRLDEAAIERTISTLVGYKQVMDSYGVTKARMVVTAAGREASNAARFLSLAGATCGVEPEVLTGEAEGVLSFAGATASLPVDGGPYLVVDIGGGSTELAVGRGGQSHPDAVVSLELGCVRLTERFLLHDPPLPSEILAASGFACSTVDQVMARQPSFAAARCVVGLAGTVSAVAAMDQGLETYDRDKIHHAVIARSSVQWWLEELSHQSSAERARHPGLEPERSDVILGGLMVLSCVLRSASAPSCLVSEADILDGIADSLLRS